MPPTEPQRNYIEILIEEIQSKFGYTPYDEEDIEEMTVPEASEIIDEMKAELGWS